MVVNLVNDGIRKLGKKVRLSRSMRQSFKHQLLFNLMIDASTPDVHVGEND